MISDTELKLKAMSILNEKLGSIQAERFVALILREPFDYTNWQKNLWSDVPVRELSRRASESSDKG